jgi:asparagine synthase (glutamine-hydrolysing)
MRDSLAHRGPDDAGLWASAADGVTLASRRLAILDLSPRGHMPMHDTSGNLTVVFNGEIYNFLELRRVLQKIYSFQSHSDTEVLLAAYSAWGPDFLHLLDGMFAFAIWDSKEHSLFAARDRFGEKPFYYFHRSPLFLFGSEIKAILASGMMQPEPNPSAIYRFLAYRETDAGEETFFKDILALPAAHALLYSPSQDTLKTWQYWDLDTAAEVRLVDDRAYADHFLELLRRSVRRRLLSDVPVGSCLSGGIDSSSIVSLVAEHRQGIRQSTFSARFEDPQIDEGQYIQPVTKQVSATNHSVYPDPLRMLDEMETLAWHQEHPFVGPSVYAQWCVMRLAQEHGTTVLLDGQGADEGLAGYLVSKGFHYRDQLLDLHWVTLLKSLAEQVNHGGSQSILAMMASQLPTATGLWRHFRPEPLALVTDFSKLAEAPPTPVRVKFKSALHNELYRQLRCSMLPKLLRFADRSSMAFSREARLPFLDHRILEYLFAIPETQKIRGGMTKFVLRNAMRGRLPDTVLKRRDKKGFETPQSVWLSGPLRAWSEDIFRSDTFRERGWIDQKAALEVWGRFISRPNRHQSLLFRWLSLETWARVFLKPSAVFSRVPEHKTLPVSTVKGCTEVFVQGA